MPNNITQPAVFLQSGSPETENRAADGLSGGQLGSRITVKVPPATAGGDQLAKGYQLVQVDSAMGTAPSAGAVAYWRRSSGYVVTTDPAIAGRGNVAGVFRLAATVDYICCIQQTGLVTDLQVQTGTPLDTGLEVIPSATAGKADVMAAGTAATYPVMGRSKSTALAGVFSADLTLPGRP